MITRAPTPLYEQILLYFEQQIFSGVLAPGTRIEPTTELAKKFGVNPETVQIALKKLMERGLLDRRRGVGTFVRKGIPGRKVAIVFGEENFTILDRTFYNRLMQRLMKRLTEQGWDFRHFIATEAPERDATFHELETQIADGEIRAVIEFCSNDLIRGWLSNQCPVPYSLCALRADLPDMAARSLRYLYRMGRTRPVLLLGSEKECTSKEIHKAAEQAAKDAGQDPQKLVFRKADSTQRGGYQETCKLLQEGAAFDSLIVFFDSACRGVLYALLEKGIRIPQDVALITHANKGIEIFSHLPLTRMEVDPDTFATELIREITMKMAGEPYTPLPVRAKLIPGRSCGEDESAPARAYTQKQSS